MEKTIALTTASIKDIDRLCELLNTLFSFEEEFTPDKKTQQKALQHIIENPIIGTIYTIQENGYIIGMVNILFSYSTALASKVAILEDMIIDTNYRQKGYGEQLISHAINELRKTGYKRITLLTDNSNNYAQSFYKKVGFENSSMVIMRNYL